VVDVASGELVDGPIDRARYSPVAWLRVARPSTTSGGSLRRTCAGGEQQYHRVCGWHRLGSDPSDDV
jgi:prolyl oligopeptidase